MNQATLRVIFPLRIKKYNVNNTSSYFYMSMAKCFQWLVKACISLRTSNSARKLICFTKNSFTVCNMVSARLFQIKHSPKPCVCFYVKQCEECTAHIHVPLWFEVGYFEQFCLPSCPDSHRPHWPLPSVLLCAVPLNHLHHRGRWGMSEAQRTWCHLAVNAEITRGGRSMGILHVIKEL